MNTSLARALPMTALLVVSLAPAAIADVIDGTHGPDVLKGTTAPDTIHGYAGNDTLSGKAGADKLYGGRGADRLYPGDDLKTDILRGGPGPDTINARIGPKGQGPDQVYAGSGDDTVRVVETAGWYTPSLNCGPGEDTLVVGFRFLRSTGCEQIVLFD